MPCGFGRFPDVLCSHFHFSKLTERYPRLDFLDEHHILRTDSTEDSVYVCDLRYGIELTTKAEAGRGDPRYKTELATEAEAGRGRFKLALPPIHPGTTSQYIRVRRNALPMRMQDQAQHELYARDNDGGGASSPPPPFRADPRARLVVLHIFTMSNELGEQQFELRIRAQVLLEHLAAKRRDANWNAVLPWSMWGADAEIIPWCRKVDLPQSHMTTYGMRVISHPPPGRYNVLYVDSYPPVTGVRTRQRILLPDKSPQYFLYALCEDGLLCYMVMSLLRSCQTQAERRID